MDRALIVTTIFPPTDALRAMTRDVKDWQLIVVGDRKTPPDWQLDGAEYLPLAEHAEIAGELAQELPHDHYSRKNVGYLHAIRGGAAVIAETDDDNAPYPSFLADLERVVRGPRATGPGWHNLYAYFTDEPIWPRGFPLERIVSSLRDPAPLSDPAELDCPVQQFLADGDPDVDAIYRLTTEKEVRFREGTVVLDPGGFCPFNSQNTVWWPEAFPLLYMPSFVTFRVADIWRSFIAQICLHAMGLRLAFHGPTVWHERHSHPLLKDFEEEIPGYLHNERILEVLSSIALASEPSDAPANLIRCYEALIGEGLVPARELELVNLWVAGLADARG